MCVASIVRMDHRMRIKILLSKTTWDVGIVTWFMVTGFLFQLCFRRFIVQQYYNTIYNIIIRIYHHCVFMCASRSIVNRGSENKIHIYIYIYTSTFARVYIYIYIHIYRSVESRHVFCTRPRKYSRRDCVRDVWSQCEDWENERERERVRKKRFNVQNARTSMSYTPTRAPIYLGTRFVGQII